MSTTTSLSLADAELVSRIVFDFAARISSEQDPDKLLQLNADMARDLVGADRCTIWMVDTQAELVRTRVAHGVDEFTIPLHQGLVGACISEDQPIVVNDVSADPRFLGKVDEATGYVTHSVLVMPLRAERGRVIGVLQLLNKPGGFTRRDIELLGLAAAYSGSTIETQRLRREAEAVRLLLRELEIAREVQCGLLPRRSPVVPALDYSAYFCPAKSVGGDYYDFLSLPNGVFTFTLGDVSGKGIAAALLMASIQSSLRAILLRMPESLAETIAEFSSTVAETTTPGKYSTLFCGRFDPSSLQLTYINCGGVAPILVREEAGVSKSYYLQQGGCPVGLIPGAKYKQETIQLQSNDVILCCSDGVTEAMNEDGAIWDDGSLEEVASGCIHLDAAKIVNSVREAVEAYVGDAEQSDDITIVALKVRS